MLLELLDELLELELDELLLVTLLLELLDDELDELLDDELLDDELELDEDRSSIDKICSRSPERGPGNCKEPVWKFNTSFALTSPEVLVSVSTACHMRLSASSTVTFSSVPE